MNREEKEAGEIAALMDRAITQRVPRLMRIKERLDDGEPITDPGS